MSTPAAIAAGSTSLRFMRQVRPTMCDASVNTIPLNPSFSRSSPWISSGESVAGIISSSVISGLKWRAYAGCMMCPAMIASSPLSMSVL